MLNKRDCFSCAVAGILLIALTPTAHAIVVYGSASRYDIAPTGPYASVGWNRVGLIGTSNLSGDPALNNVAWPISAHWALRATHVAGSTGSLTGYDIYHGGDAHHVVQAVRVGSTDLTLVRVTQPFTSFSTLYYGNSETSLDPLTGRKRELLAFGSSNSKKGTVINSVARPGVPSHPNGWNMPNVPVSEKGRVTWGRNQVASVQDVLGTQCLYSTFDQPTLNGVANPDSVGADEAAAYSGDSGGGVFIQQGGIWRLSGIIYAIDGPFFYNQNSTPTGAPYLGAIYDARDLWSDFYIDPNKPSLGTERRLITDANPVPAGMYASRISAYRTQIDTITGETAGVGVVIIPETGAGILAGCGLLSMAGLWRRRK